VALLHIVELKSCNTTLLQESVVNMGVKLYSRLPVRIKTLNGFKKEVIFLLLNNSLYTVNEFLLFNRSYYCDMSLYLM